MTDRTATPFEAAASAARLNDALAKLYYAARPAYTQDLSHQSVRVLQFLAYSATPPCVDNVARHIGTAASTASELLKRLQRKGLAERRRSRADERVVEIMLTDAGRRALAEHASLSPERLALALERLSARDRAALIRLVERLTSAATASESS